MKIKIYLLSLLLLLCALLTLACGHAEAPADTSVTDGAETPSETPLEHATQASSESITESPTEPNPIPEETEAETEYVETVAPAPEEKIHTAHATVSSSGDAVQSITDLTADMDQDKTHVRVVPPLGYACTGFVYDGIAYAGDLIPLSIIQKDISLTLKIDYATYELPIVNISVNGCEISSKTEYVDMTFSLENTDDVMINIPGGIRMRGNSTAEMPKKPYRIKFEQKHSLFGLDKAKSWVLLAEYLDPSCLHNYAAMYLGATTDKLSFTPTIHHVNLYLDGEYMGLYSLCEQVEEERLGLEQKITSSMRDLMDFSFLVCMDERAPEEDEPYFYVSSVGRYFQLKYPAQEDFTSQKQFRQFMTQLEDYYNDMADAFNSHNNSWLRQNIDTDTLIDHLIIDQIMGEEDHVWKSFYSYHDADGDQAGKISFGPTWDYDYSLYTPWTGEPNECYDIDTMVQYSNFFYRGLMASRYGTKVASRYEQHYADVLKDLIKHLQKYKADIQTSLDLNQARWYTYDPDLTEDNFDFMIKFLRSRQQVLGALWQ